IAVCVALQEVDPPRLGYPVEGCEGLPAPPHDLGRRNMVAGFAWAATVVNMRHPIVMETILKYQGEAFADNGAFSNGVTSSMIMRYDTSPDDPNIDRFINYRPRSSDAKLLRLWDRLVKEPCERAVQEVY